MKCTGMQSKAMQPLEKIPSDEMTLYFLYYSPVCDCLYPNRINVITRFFKGKIG